MNKSRQLVPLCTNKEVSLLMRGKLYNRTHNLCILHGSETWPVKKREQVDTLAG